MKIEANKLFVATVLVTAIVWIGCSLLVILIPTGMMTLSGHMVHGDFVGMGWSMTGTGFVLGLVAWSLVAGITVWLIAALYNRLVI